jgi:hypothetical protein
MVNHFFKIHENEKEASNRSPTNSIISVSRKLNDTSLNTSASGISYPQMTKTKQNQLEVSRYSYIEKPEFLFTFDYFNKSIATNYKRLKLLNELYFQKNEPVTASSPRYKHHLIDIRSKNTPSLGLGSEMNLRFQLPSRDR